MQCRNRAGDVRQRREGQSQADTREQPTVFDRSERRLRLGQRRSSFADVMDAEGAEPASGTALSSLESSELGCIS